MGALLKQDSGSEHEIDIGNESSSAQMRGVLSASSSTRRVLFWCGYFIADDRIHVK